MSLARGDSPRTSDSRPVILWLRRDLRLHDHPAWTWVLSNGRRVIPVFIDFPKSEEPWALGGASRWWLHHSLADLSKKISGLGGRLIIRKGDPLEVLKELLQTTSATSVLWSRLYEPASIARDEKIKTRLKADGYEVLSFNSSLLHEPWEIKNQSGNSYRVFTPFYRARPALNFLGAPTKLSRSRQKLWPSEWPKSLDLEALALLPKIPWDASLRSSWKPGEDGAQQSLDTLLKSRLGDYHDHRDIPSLAGTSRLSPHLHFGEISPLRIVSSLREVEPSFLRKKSSETFFRELYWREFAHHILFHFPQTPTQPLDSKFNHFPWSRDNESFRRWCRGETGFPIVDAGMRELWATGWMHNRVRMIVASFLTKDLRLSWCEGAQWFWNTLVDASLANNTLGWQWAAGCGADAAPYFRIFNPSLQSQKFDPQAVYIKKWIPELQDIDSRKLHDPAAFTAKNYPAAIVEHSTARLAALDAYRSLRSR